MPKFKLFVKTSRIVHTTPVLEGASAFCHSYRSLLFWNKRYLSQIRSQELKINNLALRVAYKSMLTDCALQIQLHKNLTNGLFWLSDFPLSSCYIGHLANSRYQPVVFWLILASCLRCAIRRVLELDVSVSVTVISNAVIVLTYERSVLTPEHKVHEQRKFCESGFECDKVSFPCNYLDTNMYTVKVHGRNR